MQRAIRAYPETQAAEAILEEQKQKFDEEHDRLMDEGKSLKAEFEDVRVQSENRALSDAARDELREKAREKMKGLVELERKIRENQRVRKRDLAEEEMRLGRRIIDKIEGKIAAYCKEHDISLVLDSASLIAGGRATVVFSEDKLDITEEIIKLTGGKEPVEDEEQ
jgi:Skp family chaperone for outer membrane proteins